MGELAIGGIVKLSQGRMMSYEGCGKRYLHMTVCFHGRTRCIDKMESFRNGSYLRNIQMVPQCAFFHRLSPSVTDAV